MAAPESPVESIFFEALAKPSPEELAIYLTEACGGDQELRRRVERLLRAQPKVGSFLQGDLPGPAATVDEPPISAAAGTVIGPYKLLQQIGEGGMGTVFMAEQTHPVQRRVALKVIKPGMDSRQVIARFEAERQALALMDHVNIARVFDGGATENGRPYFVMELVHGVPITKYCDDNRLTPRQRLELFVPVCQAIQHAHQKGIIHRDIKPSNVMVTLYDGKPVPKVIDFGVAKATEQKLTERTLFTQYGTMVGTLEYMSPEQAEMSALGVDTRSDIYSLGVLLYELLTGSTPLTHQRMKEAAYAEILRMIKEEEPPKPSTRLSDSGEALASISANRHTEPAKLTKLVRGELDWIVMKCLEKDRNRRFETANSLAQDVDRYLQDEPVLACPPSVGYRLKKFAKRNKGPVLAASLLLLTVVAGMMGTIWQAADAIRERDAKQKALDGLGREQQRTQAALDQSRLLSAELSFDKGQLLGEAGDANLALLWLARSLKLAPPSAVQLQAAIRTSLGSWQRQVDSVRLILPHDGWVRAVAFGADGQPVTANWGPRNASIAVQRWDLSSGQPGALLVVPGQESERALVFSPKADYLLFGQEVGTVQLFELATGKSVWPTGAKDLRSISAAFSPDGKIVLIGYEVGPVGARLQTGKAQLFEVATGKLLGPELGHERPVQASAFHPDGKSFVTMCGTWGDAIEKTATRFWDLHGREIRRQPIVNDCMALSVAFSPDGTKLLIGRWDRKALLWDLAGPHEPVVLQHEGPVASVAFSPDGKTLLTGSFDAAVRLWDLSGQLLGPPLRHGHRVDTAIFSPDGKAILVGSAGNDARLWGRAAGGPVESDQRRDAAAVPLAVSLDGQTMLTHDAEHTVILRDAATGQSVGKPLPHPRPGLVGGPSDLPGHCHACSPDRRWALTVVAENVAWLWDTQTGTRTELRPEPDLSTFFVAAFSPDSKLLVTGNHHWKAQVWDAATGRLLRTLAHNPVGPVFSAAFSPDGKTLMTGGADNAVRFWDLDTGKQLGAPLMHQTAVFAVAVAADGKTIVTGDSDQHVHLWDAATRQCLFHLSGHHGGVNDAVFSADGRLVLTCSRDHTARLWDTASGKPIGPPLSHAGPVIRGTFAPGGKTIRTVIQDQTTQSWRVPEPMTDSVEQIELWAQVTTGMELAADGGVNVLDAAAWQARRKELAEINKLKP